MPSPRFQSLSCVRSTMLLLILFWTSYLSRKTHDLVALVASCCLNLPPVIVNIDFQLDKIYHNLRGQTVAMCGKRFFIRLAEAGRLMLNTGNPWIMSWTGAMHWTQVKSKGSLPPLLFFLTPDSMSLATICRRLLLVQVSSLPTPTPTGVTSAQRHGIQTQGLMLVWHWLYQLSQAHTAISECFVHIQHHLFLQSIELLPSSDFQFQFPSRSIHLIIPFKSK